ncbi:DMT family transporter [Marinobacter salicampi]|uniref:DMT family transporter n=1 Tax=Marinobacter salicampi TaxID=435907 RepID=UPI00140A7878|nr:multidrug efflux SMR transporter [Marinobacter salicampi]
MSHWFLLSIAICAEVLGTSFLKSTEGFTRLVPSVVVVISYVVAFYFLSLTLKTMPVGIAYAVWAGSGVALIVLVGWVFFSQPLDTPAMVGVSLIVAGVILINGYSSSVQ